MCAESRATVKVPDESRDHSIMRAVVSTVANARTVDNSHGSYLSAMTSVAWQTYLTALLLTYLGLANNLYMCVVSKLGLKLHCIFLAVNAPYVG